MIYEMIEELKLKKVSNLIEIMQKRDFDSKINAFNKLEKMKITKNIGLFLIEASKFDYGVNDGNGGISSSLISLCFKNYYDEYTPALKKIFKYLNRDAQNRLIFLLSSIDNESSLSLYVELILKYYSDSDFIPISNLFERPHLYSVLFPKLYKALKFKKAKNNILIILNDYLNAGVVSKVDIKKNRKVIEDSIINVFDEALSFKFTNTTKALQNKEYFDLRFFLEICVNIESYISSKRTEEYLKKLFKKADNQLNLFILENYIKKEKDISKISLDAISKDDASRYPLFDMLDAYNKKELIPKKYLTCELIAKSDFYINFMIYTKYEEAPKSYKYVTSREIDGYKYYIFKFKHTYTYDNRPMDFATSYVMHQSGLDKYQTSKVTKDFIGISGGYKGDKPSVLAFNHNRLIFSKIEKDETEEDIINKLFDDIKKDIDSKKAELEPNTINENVKEKKKFSFSFSYILIFLLFIFIALLVSCVVYAYDPSIIKINNGSSNFTTSKLNVSDKFREIDGKDIYNQAEEQYYVLFYEKGESDKNKYYTYINEYINNNITVYYVNMNDDKNKFLYENNDLNFVIEKDRFLKVRDKDFEYYVDGKINILKEMKSQMDKINSEKNK